MLIYSNNKITQNLLWKTSFLCNHGSIHTAFLVHMVAWTWHNNDKENIDEWDFLWTKKDLSILGTPSVLNVWLVLRAYGLANTVHCICKNVIHLLSLYIPLTNHVQGLYESYGPSFFLFINHQEKTRIHNIHYGPKKGG